MAARKSKAKKEETKALSTWAGELERYAQEVIEKEKNSGGGAKFFSLQSGVLSWDGAPVPGNEMAVVILHHVFENVYYEGEYDAERVVPPTCFALANTEEELAPHDNVIKMGQEQSEGGCEVCHNYQWGSSDKGKGKACRTTRRLAMIPAGTFNRKTEEYELWEDAEDFKSSEVGMLKLPPTSVKGFASFVKQVAMTLKRPPFGIIARVYVEPDPKKQFTVNFEALEELSDDLIPVIMERRELVLTDIMMPYDLEYDHLDVDDPSPVARTKSKKATAKKATAKKATAKKATAKKAPAKKVAIKKAAPATARARRKF